ncbi:MAG: class I SAM-dependent methyltransferase [Gammaproteobacteria bacterium]|nr:class I SAM-dependent methyltransferase [Gammaproteobacteria bacterium]
MSFKAWFKSKTADKVLSPVRELLIDLIAENNIVLEVGCGTGDLLFRASDKIGSGLGVDLDQQMINFANDRKRQQNFEHIEFVNEDITSLTDLSDRRFDVSSSTLCLHEMREEDAVSTLKTLAACSDRVLIADYGVTESFWGKISIELDELISGHYGRFRHYRKVGRIPYLAKMAGLQLVSTIDTPIDGIKIWELGKPESQP